MTKVISGQIFLQWRVSEMEIAQFVRWVEDGQIYFAFFFSSVLVPGIWFVEVAIPSLWAQALKWAGTSNSIFFDLSGTKMLIVAFFVSFWEVPTSLCPPHLLNFICSIQQQSLWRAAWLSQWRHHTLNLFQPASHWHFSTDVISCWNFIAAAKNNSPLHPPPYTK